MKVFTFTPRTAGTNIFVSHINGVQDAINYLSDELTNGIGYRDQPRVFKLATPNTGYASLNLPGATNNTDPTTLAAGDLWNNNGSLKFYTAGGTKTLAFLDSNITGTANVVVSKGGTTVGTRKQINLIEGSNVTLTVADDSANDRVNVTVNSTASATGDVSSNTATSVDNEVALFSGQGGKTIKRATITGLAKLTSGVLSAATAGTDYAAATHTHAISDVTSLQTSLDAKLPATITSAASGQYIRYSGSAWVNSAIQAGDLPTSIDAAKIANGNVSNTEFQYLDGVTSAIQVQIDGKAATSHTHAIGDVTSLQTALDGKLSATITTPSSGQYVRYNGTSWVNASIAAGDLPTAIDAAKIANGNVSNTEFQYLDGVTSAIQTQIDGKAASSHTHAISDVTNLQTSLDAKLTATITTPAGGQYVRYNGTSWVNASIGETDLPTAINAAKIANGNVSNTEFQYLDGVTSAIQTQIDGKASTSHNHALSGLSDVVLTSISNGQVLVWDTATSKWINSTVSSSGGTGDVNGPAGGLTGDEIALFSGSGGKTIKAATGTGYVKVTGGIFQTPSASIPWADVSKTGSNLTDIATRSHTSLTDIGTNTHAQIDTALTRLANTSGTNTGDQVVPANTTATSNQYFTAYNSSTGAFSRAQPTFSGLSGVSAAAPESGEYLRFDGSNWVDAYLTASWTVVIGDGVNAISTGYQLPVVYVPYNHVLTAHTILIPSGTTAETGTISIQVRRQPLANYPGTTNLTTIATPALSAQSLVTTSSLTTSVSAGIYRFNVASNTGTTKVAIIWEFYRTT